MASRNFLKHTVSTTEPVGSALGDEWYDPSTNKIYKRLAVNGTAVEFREIPSALIVESNGTTVSQSTSTINFVGYTLSVDGDGTLNINVPTASAAGANTQIQFNNSGSLGASSSLIWNNSTSTLGVTGFITTFTLSRSGNINTGTTWTTTSPIFNSAAAIITDQSGTSGTISIKAGHTFLSPNFASTSSQTITNAANLYVNGSVASTNTTITNNWAIYNDGNMRVTGTLYNDAQITAAGTFIRTGNFSRSTFTLGGAVELSAATITDTNGSGTITTKGHLGIGQATFASSNATTVTDAANLYIAGDVIAGTNTTLSNTWGIYNAGKERIAGQLLAWNTTTPGLTVGSLHLGAASATANAGSAITFGARDSSSGTTAQAGIYINSDGAYGTRMYFATTDSYANGAKSAMYIDESGRLRITRNVTSTSNTTGTLIVTGGVGISENIHYGGTLVSNSATLGSVLGNTVYYQSLRGSNGNSNYLETLMIRDSAGSTWTTAGSRIQQRIDSTWMAYQQFNGTNVNGGIEWGTGTTTTSAQAISARMRLDSSGTLRILSNVSSTSTTSGSLIVTGGVGISERLYIGGVSVQSAGAIHYDSFATVSAAGTTQATATGLTSTVNNITVVAANSGVRLMTPIGAGARILIRNATATALRVYPDTGGQINTLGANAAFTLDATTLLEFVAFSATQWYTTNATFA